MKKKRNIRLASRISDSVLFFLCGCGIIVSSFLLWNDMNVSLSKAHEEPIAIIYFKQNTAQRRLIDRNIWEILHQASALYNGDRVRTANLSEAIVVFNDGNRIELHENTLIQFFQKKEKTLVSFESGAVSVTTIPKSTDFNITMGANLVKVSPSTITNLGATSKTSDGLLTVTQGSVKIVNDEIFANSSLTQPGVVQTTLTKVSSFLQKPFGIQEIESYNNTIIYTDSVINNAPKSQTFEDGETVLLSAKPTKIIEKPKKEKPLVTSPSSTQTVMYYNGETPSVMFAWNSLSTLKLTISSSTDFSQNKTEVELENGNRIKNFTLPFAKAGERYYWYIRADNDIISSGTLFVEERPTKMIYDFAQTVFTEQQALTLSKNFEESLNVEQNAKIDKVFEAKEDVVGEVDVAKSLENMEDKSLENAELLAITEQAETTVQTEITEQKEIPEPIAPVVTETKKKEEPKTEPKAETKPEPPKEVFSKDAPTLTAPANRKVFSESNFDFANPKIQFMWQATPATTAYDFVLYNSKDRFTPLLTKTLKKTQYTLQGDDFFVLDEGTFVWQVTAKSGNEKSAVATSEFTIKLSDMGSVEIDDSTIIHKE